MVATDFSITKSNFLSLESAFDGVNNLTNESRGIRGGFWFNSGVVLRFSIRFNVNPPNESDSLGFRVAAIPEPSTYAAIFGSFGLLLVLVRRFRRQR